jgi:hypothetical protein
MTDDRHPRDEAARHHADEHRSGPAISLPAATVILLALTVAATWPLARQLSTGVSDFGDPLLNSWALGWIAHALAPISNWWVGSRGGAAASLPSSGWRRPRHRADDTA